MIGRNRQWQVPEDERLAVTLTVTELRQLVAEVAREALADGPPPGPALLDKKGLAQALRVSTSTVSRLLREGCPMIRIGDSPRFELAACMEWLRRRGPPEHS